MRCWIRDEHAPGLNLAYEEALLRQGVPDGAFWLWRNCPSIIVGRNQVPEVEVSVPLVQAKGLNVYRRCTGGGAVYHDAGVINFSFVVPLSTPVRGLLDAVVDALGIEGAVSDRNDVLCEGFKVIGTAQALLGGYRLFHGSILYDADIETLSAVLTPRASKLARHGVASVAARVSNLKSLFRMEFSTVDYMRIILGRVASVRGWTPGQPVRPVTPSRPVSACVF